MKIVFSQEETQEIQHPTLPIKVVALVPTAVQAQEIRDQMGKTVTKIRMDPNDSKKPLFVNGKTEEYREWVPAPVEKAIEAMAKIIRSVDGDFELLDDHGDPYTPNMVEWLNKFTMPQFQYTRKDPVLLRVDEHTSIFRDPDTSVEIPEENRRLWFDPATGDRGMYLWDAGKNEPVRREQRQTFWQEILDRTMNRRVGAEEAEKKDLPAPSIA